MDNTPPSPFILSFQRLGRISAAEQRHLDALVADDHRIGPRRKLIDDGRRCDQVFILKQGWVAELKQLRDGGRQILGFRLPGEIIGTECLIYDTALHATVTLTDCRVACIPRAALERTQQEFPRLSAALFLFALRDQAILHSWMVNLGRRSAFGRVTHLLLELTRRLNIRGIAGGLHVFLPLTQQEIADCTGLTAPYVNRILQDLRQRGLVSLRDQMLEILRVEELAKLAGFRPDYIQVLPHLPEMQEAPARAEAVPAVDPGRGLAFDLTRPAHQLPSSATQ